MILLDTLIDSLQYIELMEYLQSLNVEETTNSGELNLTNILLSIIGVFGTIIGSIFAVIKVRENNRQKAAEKNHELKKLNAEADIENQMQFQEKIVHKFFEEYVKQNTWITDQFATKFEVLLEQIQSHNKMMKDVYAQIDTFRKELRSYDKSSTVNQKKIETLSSTILQILKKDNKQ